MMDEIGLPEALEKTASAGPEDLNRKIRSLERLLEISRQVSTLDLDKVLRLIMKNILEMTRAGRGMLLLRGDDGKMHFEFSVNLDKEEVDSDDFEICRSIVEETVRKERIRVVKNVPAAGIDASSSFTFLGLSAVMVIPLMIRDRILGVIYVDTDSREHKIYEADLSIYKGFASQAAVALENARLHHNLREDYKSLERSLAGAAEFDQIIYQSAAMEHVCCQIRQTLTNNITVLIEGETGTGKELVARAIHSNGLRKNKHFLSQNAGALPDAILESELFGHRRGAFSGAVEHKAGLFEVADGGTVFLDEIGEASPALQVRLLRLLETGSYRRVGENTDRHTDVRIIAATNRDLRREVAEGRFREDLFYRLSVFPITLPPLIERKEDIVLLAHHFINVFNKELGRQITHISSATRDLLMQNHWAGNIRELKNTIQRMMVMTPPDEPVLSSDGLDLPEESPEPQEDMGIYVKEESGQMRLKTLEEVESEHICSVLQGVDGNQVQAAKLLGLNRSTLRWRMKKLGIPPKRSDGLPNQA